MAVAVERKVIGVDLDDTVFGREIATRLFGHAKNLLLRPSFPKKSLGEITDFIHRPQDIAIHGWKESISAFFHAKRVAIPWVAEKLKDEVADGAIIYAISGRRATTPWYEMTQAQLIEANIPVEGIYLAPLGKSGLESKADSIRQLEITDFYEDDRRSVRYLAKLFPHIRFNYIDHGLAHLSEKDLADNPNISVISISELSASQENSEKESAVRNSELRKLTAPLDSVVEFINRRLPTVKPWHLTAAGVIFSIAGIELAEYQNWTGKHTSRKTALAVTSVSIGSILDLLDGKLARIKRKEMTREEAEEDERRGQALDPAADGAIEAVQAATAALIAKKRGDEFGMSMALKRLSTTNLPRLTKALAGSFGIPVPETYRITDVLHGDFRFFGTSLGRKGPNYLATFLPTFRGVTLQGWLDVIATSANGIVATERLIKAFLSSTGGKGLSQKEVEHARYRTRVLGGESLFFIGGSYFLKKMLSGERKQKK